MTTTLDLSNAKAIVYSDGGCRPNPGYPGWGVHGYIYDDKEAKKSTGLPAQLITTDGYVPATVLAKSSFKNVNVLKYLDMFGSTNVINSNNTAEVLGAINALETLDKKGVGHIKLLTDSQYVVKGIAEWVPIWKSRNWIRTDGTPVRNADEWKRLADIHSKIINKGGAVDISWVKGHNGNHGNVKADLLATLGVSHSINGSLINEVTMSDADKYWKYDADVHPFLSFNTLFFNSVRQYHRPGHYNLAKPVKEDFLIGKKTPVAAFSLVKLATPDPVLEIVIDKQCDVANDINALMVMRLSNVLHPETYCNIHERKNYSLLKSSKANMSLEFLDKTPITTELNPIGIGNRAIDVFNQLEELLSKYLDDKVKPNHPHKDHFKAHDVTDRFFIMDGRKTKFNPTITSEVKDLKIPLNVMVGDDNHLIDFTLLLGTDVLPRNGLKKLETLKPRISILTWSLSQHSVDYACLIEVVDAIGIWSNVFTNTILIKPKKGIVK